MFRSRTLSIAVLLAFTGLVGAQTPAESRAQADTLYGQNNYKEALDIYGRLARDTANQSAAAATDLERAVQCLGRLNRWAEIDALTEGAVATHAAHWQLLRTAAKTYYRGQHYGFIIAGEFQRGWHRGGGRNVAVQEQDRQRALQLMSQAAAAADGHASAAQHADLLEEFAGMFLGYRGYSDSWRLQVATDLKTPPDYLDTSLVAAGTTGAPAAADGTPVVYTVPESFDAAVNDGERWRWLLHRAAILEPARGPRLQLAFADFLRSQFGVNTARSYGGLFGPTEGDTPRRFSVNDLDEDESIARLATGVQRFKLPDGFNFIRLYQAISKQRPPVGASPLHGLRYRYYEGSWSQLPDFGALKPVASGPVPGDLISLDVAPRADTFGLVFEGEIDVPREGEYAFSLASDDGSRLEVGADFTLDNDGLHSLDTEKTGSCRLKPGRHPIRLSFFERTGEEGVVLTWSGPGFSHQALSADRGTIPAEQALDRLASVFENRRQYPKAARYWAESIEDFGPGRDGWKRKRLAQIQGNWGRFEPTGTYPAGTKAKLEYRFRNARRVNFTAHAIKVDALLADVKEYLKSNPQKWDGRQANVGNIGYRLVHDNEQKYLGAEVARWDLDLEPAPDHLDRRVTVATPLEKAGAYLVTAELVKGNVSKIVVWLHDTVLVKQALDKQTWLLAADAVSGSPLPKLNVEFFGYRRNYDRKQRHYDVETRQFAEFTDADGQLTLGPQQLPANFSWLIIGSDAAGRLAYLGFTGVWYRDYHDAEYKQTKVFGITDRPVYRPNQPVQYKFWIRHAQYDQKDVSQFAGQEFLLSVHDPRGEKLVEKRVTTDTYGGFDSQWLIPQDATLGVYTFRLRYPGPKKRWLPVNCRFRVEEYKKPEFEVEVEAPTEPKRLGEKVKATIRAKYLFGAPVTKATVKYKVLRDSHEADWYPPAPWDWFYGPGYWWFADNYEWYPGWRSWGVPRPHYWWWPRRHDPPEVVAETEVPIGEDGTVEIEIDTQLAAELHGDTDHRYSITAEVTDLSRRTIVGTGQVLVTREPFKVYVWTGRGYYLAGDTVHASVCARTGDGQPVSAPAAVKLMRIRYEDGKPVETAVQDWQLRLDDSGGTELQLVAAAAGQYRLAVSVTDAAGHTREGGYLFHVRDRGFTGREYRFNHLELLTDKAEYAPGDHVELAVNTDRADSTVVLFVRPSNGVYLKPTTLRLAGKSVVHEIVISRKDMPNFFVEAVTVSDGKIHRVVREIVVPPAKRVLDVELLPSEKAYKPGQKATLKVKVTELDGRPFTGSTVLAVYDRAVDYIAGGTNVPEIRAFFWKWRRRHRSRAEDSLSGHFGNMTLPDAEGMANIGAFGHVTEGEEMLQVKRKGMVQFFAGVGGGGGFAARRTVAKAAAAPAMAMDAMAAAPMEMAANANGRALAEADGQTDKGSVSAAAQAPEPTVRSEFADTAFWAADVSTDAEGVAELTFTMPENLTGWRIKAWAMGHGTKVGEGSTEVVTRKDLILRQQAPRFFVERDEVVLSANVHNYLEDVQSVKVSLELDGPCLETMGDASRTIRVKPGDEERVDWRVRVRHEGEAVVRMKAIGTDDADAMEQRFPVYVHGMLKMDAVSGVVRPAEKTQRFTITVPNERRVDQTRFEVRFSPTLAGAMVDALPYLVSYPYGCTEQTLNRFVPTVLVQKILLDMNLDLAAVRDKRSNLNAQELGDPAKRAEQWQRWDHNPVFDVEEVRKMVKDGVRRLTNMQNRDGGWGWFSGAHEHSWPHTTATVVRGLLLAQRNDVAIAPDVLRSGTVWLEGYEKEQVQRLVNHRDKKDTPNRKAYADDLDALVYLTLAEAGPQHENAAMGEFLYRDRDRLSAYSKAMIGLAYHLLKHNDKRDMLVRNLDQFLVEDAENQTAYLNLGNGGYWWRWYGSEFEAHAYYLKLLAAVEPKSRRAAGLVKYLLNNRKHATYWNSTRDTALCIEALADYLRASGEDQPDMTVTLAVDGKVLKTERVTADRLFTFDNRLVLSGNGLSAGEHTVEVSRQGRGPVYFNAYLSNFTLEDHIGRAGLEIKVLRRLYKLVPEKHSATVAGSRGQALEQRVERRRRVPLEDGATVKSGDLIEVELEIESKNDYEYVMFEDMKAAGFEAVDQRSGYSYDGLGAYRELRDERVTFFVHRLARGRHSIAYRLRAEIPGRFSALPTRASAMYAPELKANSDEIKLQIID